MAVACAAGITQEHHQNCAVPTVTHMVSHIPPRFLCHVHEFKRLKSSTTYAAEAARSSCRFAFVNNDSVAENVRVNTNKTPMHIALEGSLLRSVVICSRSQTGTTSKTRMKVVMMRFTTNLMRWGV